MFFILAFIFTSFGDYDASEVCNHLQENRLLHSSRQEYDSII